MPIHGSDVEEAFPGLGHAVFDCNQASVDSSPLLNQQLHHLPSSRFGRDKNRSALVAIDLQLEVMACRILIEQLINDLERGILACHSQSRTSTRRLRQYVNPRIQCCCHAVVVTLPASEHELC
eukprot:scaffold4195_cov28-Tisochrysis_lutea.AAC.2